VEYEFVTTRVVCKFRGLTLLLRVRTLWRRGDGLFFEVPPLASDVLLTTLHPLLKNVLQTVDHFEISCLRFPFSWLEKPINRTGRDLNWILCWALKKWIAGTALEYPPYSPDLTPCDIWPTMKRELRGKKFRSVFEKWVERCKKCIACHGRYFEKETVTAPPQSSYSVCNNVSPQTLQTALVYSCLTMASVSNISNVPTMDANDLHRSVSSLRPEYMHRHQNNQYLNK
jgi:hypothetical protein